MVRTLKSAGLFSAGGISADAKAWASRVATLCAVLVIAIGASGMAGWLLDVPALRELIPGSPAIRPLSAVSVTLLGIALACCTAAPAVSGLLALVAATIASLSLIEPLAGAELALRKVFVHSRLLLLVSPAVAERLQPVNPVAAAAFVALGGAILAMRFAWLVIAAQTIALVTLFGGLVPVLGFVYRIDSLISPVISSTPSVPGSAAVVLLAVGVLCTTPERGAIGLLAASTAASRAARRLLLPALAVPVLFGGILLYVRQAGWFDAEGTVPVIVCALAATLGGAVLWAARTDARLEILQRRSEASLRESVDASPLVMWMADARGQGAHLNPVMREVLGQDESSLPAQDWQRAMHPDDTEHVRVSITAALASRRPFSAEFRVRVADGSWRWMLSTGMPRFTATGELSGYTGTWIDVTARKDSEAALQRFAAELEQHVSERTAALNASREELTRQSSLLESVVRSMSDGVLAISRDGELLVSNGAAEALFGASTADADDNARRPQFGFFQADGVTPFSHEELPIIRALAGENVDNVIMVTRLAGDPEGRWVRVSGRPIRDHDGNIEGSIVVGRDVTEFEKALEATRRLAAVVEASGDAILSVSLDSRILTWNRGAEQMYGWTAAEAIGQPFSRLDPSLDRAGIERMLTRQSDRAVAVRRDLVARRRDGTPIDVAATMSPLLDEAGNVTALSVVHHDVSPLKAVERRLQALNDELEQRVRDRTAALVAANHDLENYAFSVAHDLRTPLRAIAGFASVLQEDYGPSVDDEGRRLIGIVRKNAQDMGAFIDALLSFSAVDRQPPVKEHIDVAGVVRECLDSLGEEAAERDITFHVGDLPPCRADRASLKQVFLNLLANAVKFTRQAERAHIEVGSAIEGSGETAYFVRDNGVGFDMSNTRRLFGLFQRLHSPKEFEGTGLGLASVARIVAAHGGRVWAESEPGKGATFSFTVEQREGSL